jgi:hypothetical protein
MCSIHISLYVMSVYMYVHTYHTYIFSIHTHIVFRLCLASMCKGLEPIHISRVDFNVQLILTHTIHVYMFHVHVPRTCSTYTCTLHVYLYLYMLLYFTVTRRMHPYVLHMFHALCSSDLILSELPYRFLSLNLILSELPYRHSFVKAKRCCVVVSTTLLHIVREDLGNTWSAAPVLVYRPPCHPLFPLVFHKHKPFFALTW